MFPPGADIFDGLRRWPARHSALLSSLLLEVMGDAQGTMFGAAESPERKFVASRLSRRSGETCVERSRFPEPSARARIKKLDK